MKRGHSRVKSIAVSLIAVLAAGFTTPATAQKAIDLSDEQVENIVRRSYPYDGCSRASASLFQARP